VVQSSAALLDIEGKKKESGVILYAWKRFADSLVVFLTKDTQN
jgi:hypothetical protein